MNTLFEFGEEINVSNRRDLENYLFSLWNGYVELSNNKSYDKDNSRNKNYQPFLSFDGDIARANNYIGFINYNDTQIEIYPKVFKNIPNPSKDLMHGHLFYWLGYCKKIKFPFNKSYLNPYEIDQFPELIIYLIAQQIFDTINSQPYFAYEELEEALATPRGRVNFNRYTKSLSYGNYHIIDCDYEPFVFDNKLNKIIKYCVRLLLTKSKHFETQRILNDIIFIFDEVQDIVCSSQQLNNIRITSLFETYEEVIYSCSMILNNQIYSFADHEMKTWSLLFPMEYVFEDFITGFIQDHFGDVYWVEPQKSDLYLHQDPKTFNIQHDILLTNKFTNDKIIIDTKYKLRSNLSSIDNKRGVSQADMYQMISYAYRRGTDKVLLIYPNTSNELTEDYLFIVNKANENEVVKIKVIDVPFWSDKSHNAIDDQLLFKLKNVLYNDF